ncbi:MraY family glycosyltransferase [Luteimicrobium subarcticum]|uniref:UDP-GlcNAc:undecaprenyl-phosphate GlcNAc-1-phosphate transferase n=1 Tax=Luteimicrobium subarcticum TaxID=620910 RepID=A0A2M8W1J9_9MICO|nr:MraY family glycosyltransferase [Luteimicrobium subarcticum]PJI84790.1 UDP-GlcNAc:undecaprenyl-phosphate GlcNAc-1-phosphate transferase [Luteimicrobium subarcticum]
MRVYLLLLLVAGVVTLLTTPFARWVALRSGGITAVRERDVHTVPTPRLGGLAMFCGLLVAVTFASGAPFLASTFAGSGGQEIWAVVVGGGLVCAIGVADDIWDLDWMVKLAGQAVAAGYVAWQGVQLISVPIGGVTIASARVSMFVTVLVIVMAMNAVNFVDGLDGLAAGVIAIGGSAFFLYTYLLTQDVSPTDYSNRASLVLAILVGLCLGFLPYNAHPAKIFMGDSGSMLLGFTLASGAIMVTGQIDPEKVSTGQQLPAFIPILLPLAVILVPLVDMTLAVVRRVAAGKSPFHPDRMHLHHRMLALGHSHGRAVFIMYLWTAVFAFGAAALAVWPARRVAVGLVVAVLLALVLTLGPLRGKVRARRHPDSPGGTA